MTPDYEKIVLLLFLILLIPFLIETLKLPVWRAQPESGFMPLAVIVALYLILTSLFARSLKNRKTEGGGKSQLKLSLTSLAREYSRPLSFLIVTLLYVLALQTLGYYISSSLFCLAFSLLFVIGKGKLVNSLVTAAISSAISLTACYLLYEKVFSTPLG
jgi:hypothetical protein